MKSSKGKKKKEESSPIVYHDGFGNKLPDIDLELHEKLKKDIIDKFERHLEYEGNLRSGNVIYVEGEFRLSFSHEMGGGNCLVYIDIPGAGEWENQTKLPLSRRKDILEFIAAFVQKEQASNCRYEIGDNSISFYYK